MVSQTGLLCSESLLEEIRAQFCHVDSDPITGQRVYLENAGGGLTLKKIVEIVAEQTGLPDNAGRANATSPMIAELLERGRADLMQIVGARSGSVTVGPSTTANAFRILSVIISNVQGGNVVTTNLDHPAIFDSTRILCERFGKEWRVAGLNAETGRVPVESAVEQIDESTIALCVIHSSNNTGGVNDVRGMVRRAREIKPDLYVLVDGSQRAPHAPLDVEALGCDVYLWSSYKMFSKIGASAAFLSERTACLPHDQLLGKSKDDWDMGTREQAGYAAWSAVADYLSWLGGHFTRGEKKREKITAAMHAIELHERALTRLLLNGAEGLKGLLGLDRVTVHGETSNLTVREPCVLFTVEGMLSAEVVSCLGERRIRVHNRVSDVYSKHTLQALGVPEAVRVSMAHYNTPEEAVRFLRAMNELAS